MDDKELDALIDSMSPEDMRAMLADLDAEAAAESSIEIGQASPEMEKAVGFKFGEDVGALDSMAGLLDSLPLIGANRVGNRLKLGEAADQGGDALLEEQARQAGHPTENVVGGLLGGALAGRALGLGAKAAPTAAYSYTNSTAPIAAAAPTSSAVPKWLLRALYGALSVGGGTAGTALYKKVIE